MSEIVGRDNPILRGRAKTVPRSDIGSDRLKQIGEPIRLFLVSGELLKKADKTYKGDGSDMVFINPEITRRSRDKKEVEEGCLSIRWLYGKVKRSTRVTLTALDENGAKIERGASGLLSQIFQHEVDHLDGVLFTDKAREIWELSPEEIAELQNKP
jgi:peptide deformylase